jgi:hypothetical protein
MKKKSKKCCFCGADATDSGYCIPEGFPTKKEHELKPLCVACGGADGPTLDEICEKLDKELVRSGITSLMMMCGGKRKRSR